jgi:hypothetical protein
MISSPKVGQRVQVWYRKEWAAFMPWHGKLGTVVVASRGKPRNHGVFIPGFATIVVVPAGNLRVPTCDFGRTDVCGLGGTGVVCPYDSCDIETGAR